MKRKDNNQHIALLPRLRIPHQFENEMKLHLTSALSAIAFVTSPVMANIDLATKNGCMTCHQVDKKLVGPSYKDVAAKYKGQADAAKRLSDKVKVGGKDVWGQIPMPPNSNLKDGDTEVLIKWILSGAK
jgi:cytochrome c